MEYTNDNRKMSRFRHTKCRSRARKLCLHGSGHLHVLLHTVIPLISPRRRAESPRLTHTCSHGIIWRSLKAISTPRGATVRWRECFSPSGRTECLGCLWPLPVPAAAELHVAVAAKHKVIHRHHVVYRDVSPLFAQRAVYNKIRDCWNL